MIEAIIGFFDRMVNGNSISGIALCFFIVLTAGLSYTIVQMHRTRTTAQSAVAAAQDASAKVHPVSNGFAREVRKDLSQLITATDKLQEQMTDHLAWHMRQDGHE